MESNFESNSKKIWEIANDDLSDIEAALYRIRVVARSANNYFDGMLDKPSELTNNVLSLFEVIEALSESEEKNISDVVKKLVTISKEISETSRIILNSMLPTSTGKDVTK